MFVGGENGPDEKGASSGDSEDLKADIVGTIRCSRSKQRKRRDEEEKRKREKGRKRERTDVELEKDERTSRVEASEILSDELEELPQQKTYGLYDFHLTSNKMKIAYNG